MLPNKVDIAQVISAIKEKYGDISYYFFPHKNSDYNCPYTTQVMINILGENLKCWGSGDTQDEASFKAIMELLERICFLNYWPLNFKESRLLFTKEKSVAQISKEYPRAQNWIGKTTSGWSIHSSPKKALQSSISELIERHTLLSAMTKEISSHRLSLDEVKEKYWSDFKYQTYKESSVDFFVIKGALNHYVTTCRLSTPQGPYFGFGSSPNLSLSIKKSFYEIAPKIPYTYKQKDQRSIHEHSEFYFLENSDCKLQELAPIGETIKKEHFFTSVTELTDLGHLFNGLKGIYIAQVISPVLQPMFKGNWSEGLVNPLAFEGSDLKFPKFPKFPKIKHILN